MGLFIHFIIFRVIVVIIGATGLIFLKIYFLLWSEKPTLHNEKTKTLIHII
jgi:hypothetical protein